MTKSVTIVNSSNWLGEDVDIRVIGEERKVLSMKTLKPGEATTLPLDASRKTLEVESSPSRDIQPAKIGDEQYVPSVEVFWRDIYNDKEYAHRDFMDLIASDE